MKNRTKTHIFLYSSSLPLILGALIVTFIGGYYLFNKYKGDAYFYLNRGRKDYVIKQDSDKDTSGLNRLVMNEKDLNDLIDQKVEGKGVGGDTIVSMDTDIVENKILLKGNLNDGTELNGIISFSKDNSDVLVEELSLSDTGVLAKAKETLLRTLLKAGVENMIKQGNDSGFVSAEIKEGNIVVYYR